MKKTNALLSLISHRPDIDKINVYKIDFKQNHMKQDMSC